MSIQRICFIALLIAILVQPILRGVVTSKPASTQATTHASTTHASTTQAISDEVRKEYVEATEAARRRFEEEISASKKVRDEKMIKVEKVMRQESEQATDRYLSVAQKAMLKLREARKLAIAATVAAYDGMIERLSRAGDLERTAAAKEARKQFVAAALNDNEKAMSLAEAMSGIDSQGVPPVPTTQSRPVMADRIVTVVDDFVIDIYYNGQKIADSSRRMTDEIFGATIEQITLDVHQGDWIVFHVANNRLRWGGVRLFMAAGVMGDNTVVFATNPSDKRWSYCDDVEKVAKFITNRNYLSDQTAKPIDNPWGDGVNRFNALFPDANAAPIWGQSAGTWIKFMAE